MNWALNDRSLVIDCLATQYNYIQYNFQKQKVLVHEVLFSIHSLIYLKLHACTERVCGICLFLVINLARLLPRENQTFVA